MEQHPPAPFRPLWLPVLGVDHAPAPAEMGNEPAEPAAADEQVAAALKPEPECVIHTFHDLARVLRGLDTDIRHGVDAGGRLAAAAVVGQHRFGVNRGHLVGGEGVHVGRRH